VRAHREWLWDMEGGCLVSLTEHLWSNHYVPCGGSPGDEVSFCPEHLPELFLKSVFQIAHYRYIYILTS
jgi:hypothetical protein